jgi:hypothetical protein
MDNVRMPYVGEISNAALKRLPCASKRAGGNQTREQQRQRASTANAHVGAVDQPAT